MITIERPTYDPVAVLPIRKELTDVGFKELLTPEEVDAALLEASTSQSTALVVLNSVCGCAAGNARPGVASALQNSRIPDRLYTVFAGMEKAAVARLREILAPLPPSSPAMALFKDGKLAAMVHRRDIESRTADQVAELLTDLFNQHCSAKGPSIPHELYAKLELAAFCGSTMPKFQGN